jgi:hypothetical protein
MESQLWTDDLPSLRNRLYQSGHLKTPHWCALVFSPIGPRVIGSLLVNDAGFNFQPTTDLSLPAAYSDSLLASCCLIHPSYGVNATCIRDYQASLPVFRYLPRLLSKCQARGPEFGGNLHSTFIFVRHPKWWNTTRVVARHSLLLLTPLRQVNDRTHFTGPLFPTPRDERFGAFFVNLLWSAFCKCPLDCHTVLLYSTVACAYPAGVWFSTVQYQESGALISFDSGQRKRLSLKPRVDKSWHLSNNPCKLQASINLHCPLL